MESTARSLAKATSWQIIGFAAMTVTGYAFTGSLAFGGKLALVTMSGSMIAYTIHERIWARIGWGRTRDSHEDRPSHSPR